MKITTSGRKAGYPVFRPDVLCRVSPRWRIVFEGRRRLFCAQNDDVGPGRESGKYGRCGRDVLKRAAFMSVSKAPPGKRPGMQTPYDFPGGPTYALSCDETREYPSFGVFGRTGKRNSAAGKTRRRNVCHEVRCTGTLPAASSEFSGKASKLRAPAREI